jgi:hypothetical protein
VTDELSKERVDRVREWATEELVHSGTVASDELYETIIALTNVEPLNEVATRSRDPKLIERIRGTATGCAEAYTIEFLLKYGHALAEAANVVTRKIDGYEVILDPLDDATQSWEAATKDLRTAKGSDS